MRKRILVAEASDTTRRVTETVLRQNGFEVISVASADKAREVLQFARPDLIIVGGDLRGSDDAPFYEKLTSNPKTASIPLMVLESMEGTDLPFPPEVIIPQPFDPPDMLQRISAFTEQETPASGPNPLSGLPADDDFLDAALGLDRIDVTDSEILDRASLQTKGIPVAPNVERMVGYDHVDHEGEEMSDSARVESVMMRDEHADKTKAPTPELTGTSKLEIMQDQYGLADPEAYKAQKSDDPNHDYDWFINSMREEVGTPGQPAAQPAQKSLSESAKMRKTGKIPIAEDPFAEVGIDSQKIPITGGVGTKPRTAGVEKFIDEFKKEIERIRSNEPDSIFVEETHMAGGDSGQQLFWEETLEKVTPEQAELFTKQLASELAEKIAEKIVSKIDPERLLRMLKSEIVAHYKDKLK